MRHVRVPGTTLDASRLGFGTASLHHLLRRRDRLSLIAAALDAGFSYFDTARMYGEGMAERTLGEYFTPSLRQRVVLATKFGLPAHRVAERWPAYMYAQRAIGGIARRAGVSGGSERKRELDASRAESSLVASLRALRTDWLDVLFVHEPQIEDIPQLHQLATWLARIKADGRVRYVGLAGMAQNCVAVVSQIAEVFDLLQVEDSISGREADVLTSLGRPLQITYGYLRRAAEHAQEASLQAPRANEVVRAALARNTTGTILVSTRKGDRLRQLAELTEHARNE